MAAVISSVPDSDMIVKPLVTSATSIVSRRRVKISANAATTYSHVANTLGGQSTIQFDIMDSECFLDLKSLVMNGIFTPLFYKYVTTVATAFDGTGITGGIGYGAGCGPRLDGGSHALIGRLRVGNSQGMIIEDLFQYGMMKNAMDLHGGDLVDEVYNPLHQNDLVNPAPGQGRWNTDPAGSLLQTANSASYLTELAASDAGLAISSNSYTVSATAKRDLLLNFKGSSFLNSMRYLPLFLLKNGLRIEWEWENPLLAFYHSLGWPIPQLYFTPPSPGTTSLGAGNGVLTFGAATSASGGAAGIAAAGDVLLGYKNGVLIASNRVASSTATTSTMATGAVIYGTSNVMFAAADMTALALVVDAIYIVRGAANCSTGFSSAAPGGPNVCPQLAPQQSAAGLYWNYSVTSPELLLDLVKPSNDIFQEYMNRFQMPEGIPYAYNRVLYMNRSLTYPQNGAVQIPLNLAVRSLKGLVICLSDDLSISPGTAGPIYNFPSKSAFMLRGLTEAFVQVGSQSFPVYKLNMKYPAALNQLNENNCLFEKNSTSSLTLREVNRTAMDYRMIAGYTTSAGSIPVASASTFLGDCQEGYYDTRSAIVGISTMKKDGDFVSGVDTSQAGSVVLNLSFDNTKYISGKSSTAAGRNIQIHIFAVADAVFTIQKDSNGVRY